MLDIVAAVNSDDVLFANLARSPILGEAGTYFQVQRGYSSAAAAYNSALETARNDVVVFVHQDVYLPKPWSAQMASVLEHLEKFDVNWAVLGVYGITEKGEHVGYVWSSGLNQLLGTRFVHPILVDSVDELLIVVKRSSGIRFDEELSGFHLFGTDIVQTARAAGRSAYVVCAPVVHNSRPVIYLSKDYLSAYEFMRRKWKGRLPIQNCIAPIVDSIPRKLRRSIRYWIEAARHLNTDRSRHDRGYDCVSIAESAGFE